MSKPAQFNLPQSLDIDLDDSRVLDITITEEGIIMDVYGLEEARYGLPDNYDGPETHKENVHLGTAGMMFNEWADWIVQTDRSHHFINRLVQTEGDMGPEPA